MTPPIPNDVLTGMRQRRSAGERLPKLAAELGVPWQRLEKLTRLSRSPLPDDPKRLRQELRWTRLMLTSVPHLGCDKPWAIAWRDRILDRLRARIARLRRRLAVVCPESQVAEKPRRWFKLRPYTAADARIARMYNPKATSSFWSES